MKEKKKMALPGPMQHEILWCAMLISSGNLYETLILEHADAKEETG
jgi:hypothetical protein